MAFRHHPAVADFDQRLYDIVFEATQPRLASSAAGSTEALLEARFKAQRLVYRAGEISNMRKDLLLGRLANEGRVTADGRSCKPTQIGPWHVSVGKFVNSPAVSKTRLLAWLAAKGLDEEEFMRECMTTTGMGSIMRVDFAPGRVPDHPEKSIRSIPFESLPLRNLAIDEAGDPGDNQGA